MCYNHIFLLTLIILKIIQVSKLNSIKIIENDT